MSQATRFLRIACFVIGALIVCAYLGHWLFHLLSLPHLQLG